MKKRSSRWDGRRVRTRETSRSTNMPGRSCRNNESPDKERGAETASKKGNSSAVRNGCRSADDSLGRPIDRVHREPEESVGRGKG